VYRNFLIFVICAVSASAQSLFPDGIRVDSELAGATPAELRHMSVELLGSQGPGDDPFFTPYRQPVPFNFWLNFDLPPESASKPVAGTVSLWQLQHPVPTKAIRAFDKAKRHSKGRETERATAELEEAIRIDPDFREAHINLGVQYVRARRYSDALVQFETALTLGPPGAAVYSNLAWTQAALHQYAAAENSARKALAIDPNNGAASDLLRLILPSEN
jgi:tetratricopeptide (TPR) repeat protein